MYFQSEKCIDSSNSETQERSLDTYIHFDNNLRIRCLPSEIEPLTGLKSKHLPYQYLFDLPFCNKYCSEKLSLLKEGLIKDFKTKVSFTDSSSVSKILNLNFIRNHGQVFSGGILIIGDFSQEKSKSELKQSLISQEEQKELTDLRRQLKSFLYIASHDLKEPLRTIGNFSQLLGRQCQGYIDDRGQEYLNYIVNGVKSMDALINDLMQYSNLDQKHHAPEKFHLPTIIYITKQMYQRRLNAVEGKIKLGEIPNEIYADKQKFRLLTETLLSNAVKFRHPDRPLEIEIFGRETGENYELIFRDNGIGIKKEFFGKIFEMFKKLHRKSEYKGTGIGLSIARKIAEQHHGGIRVESTYGKGSTFTVCIRKPAIGFT